MSNKFYPDFFADDFLSVDLKALKSRGIKGLIVDIDNTLAPHSQKEADKTIEKWIDKVRHHGFKICIVSNATKKRVEKFNERLDLFAIHRASKPGYKSFMKAVEYMGIRAEEACVVGDQIFTDVYGGRKLNMTTVLVKPIDRKEFIFVRIKRLLEKIVIKGWDKK